MSVNSEQNIYFYIFILINVRIGTCTKVVIIFAFWHQIFILYRTKNESNPSYTLATVASSARSSQRLSNQNWVTIFNKFMYVYKVY